VNELPKNGLPPGIILEPTPPFVPRMVLTDELRTVVREVITQWRHRDRFRGLAKFNIRPLDRLLFYGPPGNGKTMACQWICQQLATPLYRVQVDQLIGAYMGQTTQALSRVMEHLEKLERPALCLFDEIESIFVKRSASEGQCDRERATALTVFFQCLDRWRAPTLIVMCTNLAEQLDPALHSRVELHLEFRGPSFDQAREVIEYWRELLCEHGGEDWGPRLLERLDAGWMPESFRALTQRIGVEARNWVAAQIPRER
jgi:AAA+ superfamily predicted ATPase